MDIGDSTPGGAFFVSEGVGADEMLRPTSFARSGWGNGTIGGPAICAALARSAERTAAATGHGFTPVRFTADLFRPVSDEPLAVTGDIVRQGRRILVVESTMRQSDRPVARATTLLAAPSQTPDGGVWRPDPDLPEPPPVGLRDPHGARVLVARGSGDWIALADAAPSADRRAAWVLPLDVVVGEELTPFAFLASVSDVANMVAHWGDRGIRYINADVTMHLVRLPRALECGMVAADRLTGRGVSQGVTHLFDRDGLLGTVAVVGLANPVAGDPRTSGLVAVAAAPVSPAARG